MWSSATLKRTTAPRPKRWWPIWKSFRAIQSSIAASRWKRWTSTPSWRGSPQLALVNELAHTNAAGSRHPKRYQDVEELLAAGLDVYSTLNIQHLESLNDVVSQITNVVVRETIPDRVLDEVTDIELIDLPPDELLQRLHEGKVYMPEQAARAIEEFFRKGNLTALRELTMRRAAERVDDQMRAYMRTRSIPGPWAASERLLVCVTSHPISERLVRAARRLADELNAPWTVLHVELPHDVRLNAEQREQLARTLRLAEELARKRCSARASRRQRRFSIMRGGTTSPRSSSANRCARAGSNGCAVRWSSN